MYIQLRVTGGFLLSIFSIYAPQCSMQCNVWALALLSSSHYSAEGPLLCTPEDTQWQLRLSPRLLKGAPLVITATTSSSWIRLCPHLGEYHGAAGDPCSLERRFIVAIKFAQPLCLTLGSSTYLLLWTRVCAGTLSL